MSSDLETTLGGRIRHARREAGFHGPERFAVELGIGVATLQRWETGKTEPTLEKLRAVSRATGRPLSYFLNGDKAAA